MVIPGLCRGVYVGVGGGYGRMVILAPVRVPLAIRLSATRLPGELRTKTSPTVPGRPVMATLRPGQFSTMMRLIVPTRWVLIWSWLTVQLVIDTLRMTIVS